MLNKQFTYTCQLFGELNYLVSYDVICEQTQTLPSTVVNVWLMFGTLSRSSIKNIYVNVKYWLIKCAGSFLGG